MTLRFTACVVVQIAILIACVPSVTLAKTKVVTSEMSPVVEWAYDYAAANVTLGSEIKQDVTYKESQLLNLFLVRNNRLYEDDRWTKNTASDDYRIWKIFAAIAGKDFIREHFSRYATFRNADTGLLAFVEPIQKDKSGGWGLAFNANASDFKNEKWLRDAVSVLIHEYAHVLFLNRDETEHKRITAKYCKDRYLGIMGCAKKNSYIQTYVTKFWASADFKKKEKAKTYQEKHPNDFVTWYSATNPEEDMAESFTQFVLGKKPTGTTKKDLKVLFFYDYPELVSIRTHIRKEVESYYR